MATGFETFHDRGVVRNAVGFLLGLERRLEDCIRVTVLGNHDVLIDAARANGEAPSVVCVQLDNVLYVHMQFIGSCFGQKRRVVCGYGWYRVHLGLGALALSRIQALKSLLHVGTEGLGRSRALLAGVMVGETRPGGVVAGFDGG